MIFYSANIYGENFIAKIRWENVFFFFFGACLGTNASVATGVKYIGHLSIKTRHRYIIIVPSSIFSLSYCTVWIHKSKLEAKTVDSKQSYFDNCDCLTVNLTLRHLIWIIIMIKSVHVTNSKQSPKVRFIGLRAIYEV